MLFNFQSLKALKRREKKGKRRKLFAYRLSLFTTPGGVAQLGEHLPCKQGVRGSNPLISTINGLIAQPVRAHA